MHPTVELRSGRRFLMGGSMLALILVAPSLAQAQQVAGGVESVTVTGYAASLQKATDAKRESTNFTDTIFAEDIGKFPDTNIAESLNRIPGVTISREIDGEGLNVQIRGLGTNFTKVTLNGANVAVASTGAADQSNANREVDLNWFPTELFTQLSVSKSPTADLLEGGAAGNVNLRSARPFDQEGFRITYSAQGSNYSNSGQMGERGALIISDTWGSFGALIGLAGVQQQDLHHRLGRRQCRLGLAGSADRGAVSGGQLRHAGRQFLGDSRHRSDRCHHRRPGAGPAHRPGACPAGAATPASAISSKSPTRCCRAWAAPCMSAAAATATMAWSAWNGVPPRICISTST